MDLVLYTHWHWLFESLTLNVEGCAASHATQMTNWQGSEMEVSIMSDKHHMVTYIWVSNGSRLVDWWHHATLAPMSTQHNGVHCISPMKCPRYQLVKWVCKIDQWNYFYNSQKEWINDVILSIVSHMMHIIWWLAYRWRIYWLMTMVINVTFIWSNKTTDESSIEFKIVYCNTKHISHIHAIVTMI